MGQDREFPAPHERRHTDPRSQRAARDSPAPSKPRTKFLRSKSSKTDKRAQILAYAPNGNNGYPSSSGRSDPLDAAYDGDVPEWGKDYGGRKKGRNRSGTAGSESTTGREDRASGYDRGYDRPSSFDRGGDYGYGGGEQPRTGNGGNGGRTVEENWDHQF